VRLFIAINFNDETRARLLSLRDELRARSSHGNFSAPENLHLTLAFLGECNDKQAASAKAAMDAVGFAPFPATIEKVGRFGRGRGSSAIWWAGLNESPPLLALQRDLSDRLAAAGFELDQRKYSPHITLGREVDTAASPWGIEPFGETVSGIALMKSERVNGKLTYTAIYSR